MSVEDRGHLYHLGEKLIEKRKPVLIGVTALTLIFAAFALRLHLVTRFDAKVKPDSIKPA